MSFITILKKCYRHLIFLPYVKGKIKKVGKEVYFPQKFYISNLDMISIGEDVFIGEELRVLNSLAELRIGNHVMFGPRVTIITGDHRIDKIGKYMSRVTNDEKYCLIEGIVKNPYDSPILLEGDNWIGANSIILKGVTIGYGSVVAAGSVVIKSIPPYEIWGENPARFIKCRFTSDELEKHKEMLKL